MKELGFFGGKEVLRKQFGEHVDTDDSKKAAEASGAWKERKTTCKNPYCSVHGYSRRLEQVSSTARNDSVGDRYQSRVSNAYGVTDDLAMDSDRESTPQPIKKSLVSSVAGTADTSDSAMAKPRRRQLQLNRLGLYVNVLAVELIYLTAMFSCFCRSREGKLTDLVLLFPRRSKSELRRTLERVGGDFDIAITAILEDDDMANSVLDPVAESKKGHNQGNEIRLTCHMVKVYSRYMYM